MSRGIEKGESVSSKKVVQYGIFRWRREVWIQVTLFLWSHPFYMTFVQYFLESIPTTIRSIWLHSFSSFWTLSFYSHEFCLNISNIALHWACAFEKWHFLILIFRCKGGECVRINSLFMNFIALNVQSFSLYWISINFCCISYSHSFITTFVSLQILELQIHQ